MPRFGAGPRSTRQQRRAFLERAWQQFLSGVEPHGLREEILSSWRRARDAHHVDPARTRPLAALDAEALEQRRAREDCLRLAAPILRDFTQRVRLRDHVLAYFDAEGYLLAIDGDRRILERLAEIGLSPGVSWAEESAGTNGPGTALAARKPIEVFAAEHYVTAFQPWSSAAAPIRIPGSPTPAGAVAMTGPWEVRRRQAVTFVSAVARAVEERLRAARAVRDEVVRYAFRVAREAGEALVAVDGQGRVIAANEAAARWNVLESGQLPALMGEAVGGLLRAASTRSDGDVRVDLPDGPPAIVSPVSYEGSRLGAIVRLPASASGRRRLGPADRAAPARYDFACVLGNSPRVRHAVELARTAAHNDLPVVLSGESGTGKELFAQAIHGGSSRAKKPFVAVNCGSIPAELLEAELFGYDPGTFTGARREGKPGRFEDADGGTLFLDEVSELAPPAQTALLRVLQEREVVRLGGSTPRPVDVRVVAATNKPLEQEMRTGRFRSDLYYRLNVMWILVPPLRERDDDVALLARVFLDEADVEQRGLTFSEDAMEALRSYSWPGNVRELRNVVLRAVAVALRPQIGARDLFLGRAPGEGQTGAELGRAESRETGLELERGALITALDSCTWNFRRTAHQLGISRMTLYRWIRKYGITRST
jgi:sigma-54 dependent transcriptional regulator, acetoin dehydrogenase operon transcriptional activator AcoR